MSRGRRSWTSAWVAGAGLLLVPVAVLLWLGAGHASRTSASGDDLSGSAAGAVSEGAPGGGGAAARGTRRVLVGRVTGPDDEAVADAQLVIEGAAGVRTSSGDSGRYRLANVPLRAAVLAVSAEGYETVRLNVGLAATSGTQRVDIELEPLGAVRGLVLDPAGKPVAGAWVACLAEPAAGRPAGVTTEADGTFTLSAATAGCEAEASHARLGDSEPVVLESGSDNVLRLGEGASIAGVVVDEEGRPLAAAVVSVESYRPRDGDSFERARLGRMRIGRTVRVGDASGAFIIDALRAGSYVLTASATGRPPVQSEAIPLARGEQARGVRLVLSEGGVLRGQVRDAVSGDVIEGARVALDAVSTGRAHRVTPVSSDGQGAFQLDGVPLEPFSVRVSARGYRTRVLAGLRASAGEELELDVLLSARGDGGADEAEYTGIGAVLATAPTGVIIAAVIEGGPADSAGVRRRDQIVRIDGQPAHDWSLAKCVQELRGPPGSRVALTVEREPEGEVEVVITRETFVR